MATISDVIDELEEGLNNQIKSEQRPQSLSGERVGYFKALQDFREKLGKDADTDCAWEFVCLTTPNEPDCGKTYRLKIPRGWLVRTVEYSYASKKNYEYRVDQVVNFVNDPEHLWSLEVGHE